MYFLKNPCISNDFYTAGSEFMEQNIEFFRHYTTSNIISKSFTL